MNNGIFKTWAALCSAVLFFSGAVFAKDVDIADFGAKPDGVSDNTAQIQAAIDACSKSGGGSVVFGDGAYKSGTLVVKDNVVLKLAENAVLLGSENPAAYPQINLPSADADLNYALLYAKGAKNIGIEGGTIRGAGDKFTRERKNPDYHHRPRNILFDSCKNVSVRGVKMRSPAFWNAFFLHCNGVVLDSLDIFSHSNFNGDGLDIASKNVVISNCIIDAGDDGICLKNEHSQTFVVENVKVENCIVASACNLIKIGTGTQGDFKNIRVSNCVLKRPSPQALLRWDRLKKYGIEKGAVQGIAGIALEAVDGGSVDGVEVSGISMTGIQTPIFIRVDDRDNKNLLGKKSSIKNVKIDNITAVAESYITSSITAVNGYVLENVAISNCAFRLKGCPVENADKNIVPEPKKKYPENRMFGIILPAYAFFVRNADGVKLSNIVATYSGTETRPAVYAENAKNFAVENCIFQKRTGGDNFRLVNSDAKISNTLK